MSSTATLPIILVSAKTEAIANHFISELVDNEPPEATAGARVWRIANKYYRADVQLLPHADGAPVPPAVEGHVIYLDEDEVDVATCAAREPAGAAARVRVLAAAAAALPGAVAAWASHVRREPVALREPPDEREPRGLAAARAALHAHVWPGLVSAREGAPRDADSDDEWSEWRSAGEAEQAASAAQWAAALGALEGVRALRGESRVAAAERLVAAFCRALGDEL